MDFFHFKKKNTFQQFSCSICKNFLTHSHEDLDNHQKNCFSQPSFVVYSEFPKPDPSSFPGSQTEATDYDMNINDSEMKLPSSIELANTGSDPSQKQIYDPIRENKNLEKFVQNVPNFNVNSSLLSPNNSTKPYESFQMSMSSFNHSQNTNLGSINGSFLLINGMNNLNLANEKSYLSEAPGRTMVISPYEYRSRKERNKKCMRCATLRVGDMVRIFECHDIIHLHCITENYLAGSCPGCGRNIV